MRAGDILKGNDHGRNAIVIAVIVVLVHDRKRAKQQPVWRRCNGEDNAINRRGTPVTSLSSSSLHWREDRIPNNAEEEEENDEDGDDDNCVL
jgi:hypothetical protein